MVAESMVFGILMTRSVQGFSLTMLSIQPLRVSNMGFPGGAVVENLPADAGDMGSSPGLGRSHMPRSN